MAVEPFLGSRAQRALIGTSMSYHLARLLMLTPTACSCVVIIRQSTPNHYF
jgi:hypothetical protein